MSGGKVLLGGEGPSKNCEECVVSAVSAVVEKDFATEGSATVVDATQGVRKLEIESRDEIYYPSVSIVQVEAPEAMAEAIEIKFQELSAVGAENQELNVAKMEDQGLVATVAEGQGLSAAEAENREEKAEGQTVIASVVEKTSTSRRRRRGLKAWCSRLATIAVAAVAVVAVVLVGMRLAGFRTFTVMSGSMEPEYPVGAMVYVQPVDYQNLKIGDVISYVANDDKTIVTHRIVDVEVDEKDASVWRFKTKGDANASADAKLVHYKNVIGTPIITIPLIGFMAHNIQQPPGIYIALVVGTLLLAWTFLPGTLEERRKTARKSVVS